MTSTRHTEFAPFILDLVDLMDERIREAVADESSRAGAIGEAAGVAPLLCNRLREDEPKQAQFMLVFDEYLYGPHATQFWAGSPGWIAPPSRSRLPAWLARKVSLAFSGLSRPRPGSPRRRSALKRRYAGPSTTHLPRLQHRLGWAVVPVVASARY